MRKLSKSRTKLAASKLIDDHGCRLLFTLEEAESILSISRSQLYRLVMQGDLETITLGRSRRISLGQLEAFVQRLENSEGLAVIH